MLNAAKIIVYDTVRRNLPVAAWRPLFLEEEGVGGDGDDFKLK